MSEERRLYELVSVISRRHGLLALDPSSRMILDLLIEREGQNLRTSASDIISATELSRAVVYRKLSDLKKNGWLKDEWVDFKLCYVTGPKCQTLFEALSGKLQPKLA